jgi:tRNA (adenine57-N1/adenine58-N1)-methyltransferase
VKVLLAKDIKRKIVINEEKLESDLNTDLGIIKKEEILNAKNGALIKTHKGEKFFVFDANFIDIWEKISRGPQIVTLKDASIIVAYTGLNKNSIVLEAGTGSGALTCFLANIVKEIYGYEIRKDFIKITEKNLQLFGFKNVILKNKDVYKKIDEENLDAVVLDLPEPWKALKNVDKSLKEGGFLVCFLPTIVQIEKLIKELKKFNSFKINKICELIEREWKIDEKALRPKNLILGHTGFIIFVRKIFNQTRK